MSLTPKQARFVEEYLVDLNATQAAIRAGYSAKTAYSQGERLLRNVEVAAAVAEAKPARSERTKINQDWVIERLVGVYEASMEARPVCDKNGEEKGFTFNPTAANRRKGWNSGHESDNRAPGTQSKVKVTRSSPIE